MTIEDMIERWRQRKSDFARFGGQVDGQKVADQVIADLTQVAIDRDEATLTLSDAAAESGYSSRQLARMIHDGRIPNAGRANAPKILRKDLPRKPAHSSATDGKRPSHLQLSRSAVISKVNSRNRPHGNAA